MDRSIQIGNQIIHISTEDAILANEPWLINSRGYVIGVPTGRYPFERLHRVVMSRALGRDLCRHELVDHINLNICDNRRENLRLATNAENQYNRDLPAHNTTGYKGVYRNGPNSKRPWQAAITHNYRKLYLGSYATAEEAARAYDLAAKALAGEYARLNQVEGA